MIFGCFRTARILRLHPELQLPICRGDHNLTFYSNMQFCHLVCRRLKLRWTRLRWKRKGCWGVCAIWLAKSCMSLTWLLISTRPLLRWCLKSFPTYGIGLTAGMSSKVCYYYFFEFCTAAWVLDAYDILAVFYSDLYKLLSVSRNRYLNENLNHIFYKRQKRGVSRVNKFWIILGIRKQLVSVTKQKAPRGEEETFVPLTMHVVDSVCNR